MGKILNLHLFIPLRENMGNIFNIFLSSVKECWGRFLMEVVQVLVQEVQQEVFEPDQAGRPHEQSGTQQSKDEQVRNPLLVDLSYFLAICRPAGSGAGSPTGSNQSNPNSPTPSL